MKADATKIGLQKYRVKKEGMKPEAKFFEAIDAIAFDASHREIIYEKLSNTRTLVVQAKNFYSDLELAKTRAAFIKNKTLDNLDKYLIEFEANFTKKGGKVIWAQDKNEAIAEIIKISEKRTAKSLAKNRAQIFDELAINQKLSENNIKVIESDSGNFIQNLAGEAPYHPVFPTLHRSAESSFELLKNKFNLTDNATAHQIATAISNSIEEELITNEISILAPNVLVADTGSAVIFENEANAAQLSAQAKTQIILVGIEEIIPSLNDLDLFLHLYAVHSIGGHTTGYAHLISGPKMNEESDGPEEMYVILLDNGRSDVLAKTTQRPALGCIKCGACFNVCPVYKNIGGHAYQTVYNGPIGSIISPLMQGMETYKYLSFASPSAMECVSECPVKIDFPKLLQQNRTDSIKISPPGKTEKLAIYFWKTAMLKRSSMDKGGAKLKNFMLRQFFKKSWGERREIPTVAQKSFNQLWRERKGIK